MNMFYRLYSVDTASKTADLYLGLPKIFKSLEKTVFFLYGWLSSLSPPISTDLTSSLRLIIGFSEWPINTFSIECSNDGCIYLVDVVNPEEKINTLLLCPPVRMFVHLLRKPRPNEPVRNPPLSQNAFTNTNNSRNNTRHLTGRNTQNTRRRHNPRIVREDPAPKTARNPLKFTDKNKCVAPTPPPKLPQDQQGNPIIPFDEEFEKKKETNRNNILQKRQVDEAYNIYNHDKKAYLRIRDDIENNLLSRESIPEFFSDKYEVFRIMDLRNDLNGRQDPEQEFERFTNLLKVFYECKYDEDTKVNSPYQGLFSQDQVYVPHNYHYLTDTQKEECANKYGMSKTEFEAKHIQNENSTPVSQPNGYDTALKSLSNLSEQLNHDTDSDEETKPDTTNNAMNTYPNLQEWRAELDKMGI